MQVVKKRENSVFIFIGFYRNFFYESEEPTMINLADDAMTIKLDYELPEYPKFEEATVAHPAANPT